MDKETVDLHGLCEFLEKEFQYVEYRKVAESLTELLPLNVDVNYLGNGDFEILRFKKQSN
jgi:hypothetical protein